MPVMALLLRVPSVGAQLAAGLGTASVAVSQPSVVLITPHASATMDVHVAGTLDCLPGMAAPDPVQLIAIGQALYEQRQESRHAIYAVEPTRLEAHWAPSSVIANRYDLDEDLQVTVWSFESPPTLPSEYPVSWTQDAGYHDGTCVPDGYHTTVANATTRLVIVAPDTPAHVAPLAPVGAVLVLMVAAVSLARRPRQP